MTPFAPLKDPQSVLPILSAISLFGGATDKQLQELLGRLEYAALKKGDCVYHKGDEPAHICILKRGKVELQISDEQTVVDKKELGVGECFGEVSLIAMHRHTTTALVIEDCELVALSRHALIQVQQQDIALFALLMMNLARELARRIMLADNLCLLYSHRLQATPPSIKEPQRGSGL
jgi:CRP-like cAMP-binding protein